MARSGQVKAIASLLYSGQLQDATAACESVLRDYPKDDQVLALHGQALAQQRLYDGALTSLMKAIRLEPRSPEYITLLGELHMNCGRFREALVQFDKALKYRPDYDPAVADKANTYLRMGKPRKARRTIEQRLQLGPPSPPIAVLQARILIKLDETAEAISALTPWLDSDQLPIENRRSVFFTLGDAHEKARRYEEAFEAYQQANSLAGDRWNPQQQKTLHESIAAAYDRSALEALPTSGVDGSRHVFIIGMPRCGSTLTEQIIHCHPAAYGVGESECMPDLVRHVHERIPSSDSWPSCASSLDVTALEATARQYIERVQLHAGKAARIIDKQLGNYLFTGLIEKLLPGARIIHCRRHPMDMCLSGWTKQFPPGTNAWADSLKGAGQLYRLYEELMDHWISECSAPIFQVRYEDLVLDLEGTSRSILDFCDLEWDPACLRFWENKRTTLTLSNDQVRQPLYQSASGRHAAWGDLLEPLRTALGEAVDHYENH